jgi:hypothetical protein
VLDNLSGFGALFPARRNPGGIVTDGIGPDGFVLGGVPPTEPPLKELPREPLAFADRRANWRTRLS